MRAILSDGVEFEIPDAWWQKAGMLTFVRTASSHRSSPHPDHPDYPLTVVSIDQIKPIHRNPGIILDSGGFGQDRMIEILKGFVSDDAVPPIKVSLLDDPRYAYRVYDGAHRFHASVAAGFSEQAVIIGKWGFDALE